MRILILDDSQDLLELCTLMLEKDYTVSTCNNCNNILEMVERNKPDLILMDSQIPGKGGVYAAKLIKNDPRYKCIPLILFSAIHDLETKVIEAGADGLFKKPFNIDDFQKMICGNIRKPKLGQPLDSDFKNSWLAESTNHFCFHLSR